MVLTMAVLVRLSILIVFALVSSSNGEEIVHRAKRYIEYGPDIAGPFCATRPEGCCPGRIDDCSVPILDTLCYCDRFCNRTRSDCCPDYFSYCFGQVRTTPAPLRGKSASISLSLLLLHWLVVLAFAAV